MYNNYVNGEIVFTNSVADKLINNLKDLTTSSSLNKKPFHQEVPDLLDNYRIVKKYTSEVEESPNPTQNSLN
jgi:hypothetical protein